MSVSGLNKSQEGPAPQIDTQDAVPPITSLCAYTRDRPQSLQRMLSSCAHSARNHGRQIRFVVTDQSDAPATRRANIESLESTKNTFGIPCFYAAHDEKAHFAKQLAKHSGLEPDLVQFAVCHEENGLPAYGANRNALLLATLDELTLQLSDDIVCQFTRAGDVHAGDVQQSLALTSDINPQELCHLTEDEYLSYIGASQSDDIFSIHELLLGKALTSCIKEYSSGQTSVDLGRCDLSFWGKLGPRRVAVTSAGLVGDTAMGTPYWALFSPGKSRETFMSSEAKYRFCLERQIVARVAKELTIAERGWKGGPCEGLDNRNLLPPFTPVQRGEDVIFGMLLEFSSSGYIGYLPWMVHHKRPSNHRFQMDEIVEFATRTCSYNIMKAVLEDSQFPNCSDATENLCAVGRILEEWGALPRKDFEEAVRQKLSHRWLKQIELIEKLLDTHRRQPEFWADDVTKCLTGLRSAVNSQRAVLGSDLAGSDDNVDCLSMMQKYMAKFGALLQVWPALRQASRELHLRGVELARPI